MGARHAVYDQGAGPVDGLEAGRCRRLVGQTLGQSQERRPPGLPALTVGSLDEGLHVEGRVPEPGLGVGAAHDLGLRPCRVIEAGSVPALGRLAGGSE
jgi:hypothetical protein